MQVTIKRLVVALEALGYQCQDLDGSLIATNGQNQLNFVEDSIGEAVGVIPANVQQALSQITEAQVAERFGATALNEMGYGDFKPSSAKPTGVDDVNAKALGIDTGEQAVTDQQPQKGPKTPQNASNLPGDFTGDSDNNQPHGLPSTGGDTEAAKVGPHGAAKTGSPGPNNQKPEKTQGIKVGQSLQQPGSPDADDSGDYEGSGVGEIGNKEGGRDGGKHPSMGSSPAPLPTTQGAQAQAKIPSPGKGKMAVTKGTVESVLDEYFFPDQQPEGAEWPEYEEGYMAAVDEAAQSMVGQSLEEMAVDEEILRQSHAQQMSPEAVVQQLAAERGLEVRDTGFHVEGAGDVARAVGRGAQAVAGAVGRGAQKAWRGAKKAGKAVRKGVGKATEVAGEMGRVAGGVADVAGDVISTAGKGVGAAGDYTARAGRAIAGESRVDRILKHIPESYGILAETNPGPVIHPETMTPIDLDEMERNLTPIFARMILEQDPDDEDEFAPPPPPGGDIGGEEPGAPGDEFGDEPPGLGGEEGMPPEEPGMEGEEEGLPPEDGAGEGGPGAGAPVDVDIGGEPAPQPIGDEQGEPGIEAGAPEPELPQDSRWSQAKQQCPDCDDVALEKLVQVGIIGDLYNALVQRVTATALQHEPEEGPEALVASRQGGQDATNLTERSRTSISEIERQRQMSEAWIDDPNAFVDSLVDALGQDPEKVKRAASMVLGISEADYREQDVQEARGILEGLGESIRNVRNELQEVRLAQVGKIMALVGSKMSRGAFTVEAQQMMDHLLRAEETLNAFLASLDRRIEEFDQRYQGVVQGMEQGGGEPPPTPGAEAPTPPAGGAEAPPLPGEEPAPAPTPA